MGLQERATGEPFFKRRKPISVSQASLVKGSFHDTSRRLPLVVEPAVERLNMVAWAETSATFINQQLNLYGAILFRGFTPPSLSEFEEFVRVTSGEPLSYTERSSPRSQVSGNIFTSTDYPAEYPIFLHNEQSYNQTFPMRIFFYCQVPSATGGETPIADTRRVFQRLMPDTRRRFEETGYMYTRNFGDGFGLNWQTAFQTTDPSIVEEYCCANGIEFQWKDAQRLKTSQVRRVAARHPETGEAVWFNHAIFFHVSTLEPEIQAMLWEEFKEEDLPNNTYYGDGSPIEQAVLEELRAAYLAEKRMFQWQEGDVLMLDNMLSSHGREPYTGVRKVVVSMARVCSWSEV